MKFIVNESFQWRGLHKSGVTLTVAESTLKTEIERGYHPVEVRGKKRWMSGLIQHCTPANQDTADFIEKFAGKKVKPAKAKDDEKDDSKEINEIRAELDLMGKAYHPRLGLKKLRLLLIKAKKEVGEVRKDPKPEETVIKE